jgi:hypothetical protein
MDKLKEQLKQISKQEIIENKKKEDEISDVEGDDTISKMTNDEIKEGAISHDVTEKIVAYVRIDDMIRKKQEEMRELKEMKKPCEEVIIKYLEMNEQDHFTLGKSGGKIVKQERKIQAPLKMEMVKDAIKEHLIKEKIVDTDDRCVQIFENISKLINIKRPITTKVTVRRSLKRKPKNKV